MAQTANSPLRILHSRLLFWIRRPPCFPTLWNSIEKTSLNEQFDRLLEAERPACFLFVSSESVRLSVVSERVHIAGPHDACYNTCIAIAWCSCGGWTDGRKSQKNICCRRPCCIHSLAEGGVNRISGTPWLRACFSAKSVVRQSRTAISTSDLIRIYLVCGLVRDDDARPLDLI